MNVLCCRIFLWPRQCLMNVLCCRIFLWPRQWRQLFLCCRIPLWPRLTYFLYCSASHCVCQFCQSLWHNYCPGQSGLAGTIIMLYWPESKFLYTETIKLYCIVYIVRASQDSVWHIVTANTESVWHHYCPCQSRISMTYCQGQSKVSMT